MSTRTAANPFRIAVSQLYFDAGTLPNRGVWGNLPNKLFSLIPPLPLPALPSVASSSPATSGAEKSGVHLGEVIEADRLLRHDQDSEIRTVQVLLPRAKQLKALRKQAKEKAKVNAGKDWYNLENPPDTEETKRDLEIIRMRRMLASKSLHKAGGLDKELPKFFALGTVIGDHTEGREGKLAKRKRGVNVLEELMKDDELVAKASREAKKIRGEAEKRVLKRGKVHHKGDDNKASKKKRK